MTYQSVNRNSTIVKYCHDSSKTITSRFIQKLIYYKNNPELGKSLFFLWCQKMRFSETIISLKLRCLMPLPAITLFVRGDSCLQSTYPCLSSIKYFTRFPLCSQDQKIFLQYSDPISCYSGQPSHVALFRNVSRLKSIMLFASVL